MDPEKSSNSSFEDLSNLNENEDAKIIVHNDKDTAENKDTKESTPEINNRTNEEEIVKQEEVECPEDPIIDIVGNGQLTKKIIVKGPSDFKPTRGDICKLNLIGKLMDSDIIVENMPNLTVQVGDVEVVQGIDMAIPLMNVGETAEIFVDHRFGYGTFGFKNEENNELSIPPNAKLIYTVELLNCKEEEDLESIAFTHRKKIGNHKRERGNFWYDRNEYNLAIQCYRRALEYLDENDTNVNGETKQIMTNAELQELLEDRVKVYNNLALAQMKISAYDTALQSVEHVLRCQPNNVKALFRKGKILDTKGDTNGAIPILQKAATLDPDSRAIQQELSKLILKQRREARNEQDLYQKMLGHAQKLEQTKKQKSDNREAPKFKLWAYFMGSILIGVAGVAMYRYKYF